MKNLVPHFVQEQFQRGAEQGQFEAYAMFVDISGFTRLTETLLQQGKTGAERLSNILNAIFGPMVGLVYSRGGFIPYFAGDAFTGIFPIDGCQCSANELLTLAQQQFVLIEKASAEHFPDFKMGLKMGLSFGQVHWGIVGKELKSYYFRGPAILGAAYSQLQAKEKEIIADICFVRRLTEGTAFSTIAAEGFYKIEEPLKGVLINKHQLRKLPPLLPEVVARFLPEEVVQFNQQGEFRTVVSVFISFEGLDTHQELDDFNSIVLTESSSFSGYFKEIDFGDKGGVLVIIFGAPVSFENNVERALEFVCVLSHELLPLQMATGMRFKTGIASGIAYTGIIGGQERCQYAAVGNRVNIAARLMMQADWGEVLVDAEVHKSRHFRFHHKGDITYKGLLERIPTYKLTGRNLEERRTFDGAMIGRNAELESLIDFAKNALANAHPAIAYIYGEAGIGKTRLSFEFRQRLSRQLRLNWFTCQSDQILRKPFNPFIYFLRTYFEQSSDNNPATNLRNFEEQFTQLINAIINYSELGMESIKREIIRTKPFLAALVGLKTDNLLWDNLDAKGRYENTLSALSSLFQAEALVQPLVIELEDGHWYDENSKEFLNEFASRLKDSPVFILVSSRYDDEGNKPRLLHHHVVEKNNILCLEMDLNIMDEASLCAFAAERLGGPIHARLPELLLRTTNGNPFYTEQMLEYFLESDLLKKEGDVWTVNDENVGISGSIQAILTARIDRLSVLIKETVKAAAVIGREFELPVLSEVMKENEEMAPYATDAPFVLKEQVKAAERAQIWQAMNELRYIFKHSLLREAVYDMQLKTRLKELHKLIAQAIENLYAENLEHKYVDLVFHFEQAEVEDKLRHYLHKAADHARAYYQNQQALNFYDKLLAMLEKEGTPADVANILLKKASILELIGLWDDCEAVYRKALDLARITEDSQLLGKANNDLGNLLMMKGKYEDADGHLETAAAFFGANHDNRGTSKVYGNLGTLYFRQGKYEDAKLYFIRSIQLAQLYKHSPANAKIVATLGLTYMNLGKYEDGIRWQKSQLDICQQVNDRQGMAILYVNMGIVHFEKGDYDAALACYEKGMTLSEELGNKQLISIAMGCIGNVHQRRGNFALAKELFEKDLAITEELGDRQGLSIALGLMGELQAIMGGFDDAIMYSERNLAISEELGYRKGIAKAANNLGDIYFYKNEFETSISYYNRSIALTRKIGNKLVLGFSLAEKGQVLIHTGKTTEAYAHLKEATGIATELNHPDLLFETKLLAAKLAIAKKDQEEARNILESLLTIELSKKDEAAIHFEFSKIEEGDTHKKKALGLYQELYRESPMYLFKLRIRELAAAH